MFMGIRKVFRIIFGTVDFLPNYICHKILRPKYLITQ